jgi:GDP-L-fucose synthase
MVGSSVVRALAGAGYHNIIGRTSTELDLRDQRAVEAFFQEVRPAFVVLAAARVGGILANASEPVPFLHDNLRIALNVIDAAHRTEVNRLLFLGSSCIYPKHAPQPLCEEYLLTGPLEPTNQWYAIAKIAGVKLCQAYRSQFGNDFVSLMPTNLYGPDDNFDLDTSHVLPALIRKFHEAKDPQGGDDRPVTLWGTGEPRREFLHTDDLADACVHVLEIPEDDLWNVAADGLLNVGVGQDLRISELAAEVRKVVSSGSEIVLDTTKPDGTPRKLLNVDRMRSLGWEARTSLAAGLGEVYEWFLEHYDQIVERESADD